MLTSDRLSGGLAGQLVYPEDGDWDAARSAFNLLLDQQPAAVAFPADEGDIASLMAVAQRHGLRVTAQATGHNAGPLGSLHDALLVNTSALDDVSIDAAGGRVRVGAGTRWERVIEPLSDLGLAALHGSSPDVGIVGYSLGGGVGWLARKHGLQANSVTAIELVTADGCLRHVDKTHEPELFWALRGGGGSFGVVTAIEFAAYPVSELYAGAMLFDFDRSAEVLRAWSAILPWLPEELTTWAALLHVPDFPFVEQALRGRSFAAVMGTFLGSPADGSELLAPIRELRPAIDTFAAVPPAALADLAMDPPDPLPYLSAHELLGELAVDAIDDLAATADRSSLLTVVQLRHIGGALARSPEGAGARATLPGEVAMFALGIPTSEQSMLTVQSSLEAITELVAPARVGRYASFVERPADASEFFDAASWARLRRVKRLYDPRDLVRGNHHVSPAPSPMPAQLDRW
ncbi:MAG: FAD-binding oxidoreductase [Solirubrobacteraceae bacterium]